MPITIMDGAKANGKVSLTLLPGRLSVTAAHAITKKTSTEESGQLAPAPTITNSAPARNSKTAHAQKTNPTVPAPTVTNTVPNTVAV